MVDVPDTRYAKTADDVHIAYQVVGGGPPDVIYANSFMSHIEVSWEYPRAAGFYERMAAFSRLVLFDRRGTGLSDPIVGHFTMDDRIDPSAAIAPRRIVDIVPDCGPLGGIHAALTAARGDAVFVAACDMPFLSVAFVSYLLGLARG